MTAPSLVRGFDTGHFPKDMSAKASRVQQSVEGYLSFVDSQLISSDTINVKADEVFSRGTAAIGELVVFYKDIMPALLELQQQRLDSLVFKRNLVCAVIGIGVFLAAYLFIGFFNATVQMVERFSEASKALSNGQLTARLAVNGRDEMVRVSEGLNDLAGNFAQLVGEVQGSTGVVDEATRKMAADTQETLTNVARQKQETIALQQGIDQLTDRASNITEVTNTAVSLAEQADEKAKHGRSVIQRSAEEFRSMTGDVSRTAEVVGRLDEDVKNISNISESIKGIAEQTNLLALNAAIEAARAGEQGRGFAVVADEVRNLAQRTQISTEEIQSTVSELTGRTEQAVKLMNLIHEHVSKNVEQMDNVSDILNEIDQQVEQINHINSDIAVSAQDQSERARVLFSSIGSISELADASESSAQRTSALSDNLSEESNKLRQRLDRYEC